MGAQHSPAPNTILGAVHWYADIHFGTHLWVCQMMLGLGENPKHKEEDFLNPQRGDLWDFFQESTLRDGMLGLYLFTDRDHGSILCMVETTLPYDAEITEQQLLNLVQDFRDYVRSLALAKSGDGALITDPNDPRYNEASNQEWLREVNELNQVLGATFEVAKERLRSEGVEVKDSADEPEDEIPF